LDRTHNQPNANDFVANALPPELVRITEFLNEQMNRDSSAAGDC
jgi:hypothetical protein